MSLEQWFMIGLGVLGFLLHASVTLVTVSRWLFNMKGELGKEISDHKLGMTDQVAQVKIASAAAIAVLRDELDTAIQSIGDRTADAVLAVRTKLQEVELWTRDHLVERGSFESVVTRIEGNHEKMSKKIDDRLEKLDEKLDRLAEQLSRRSA